MAENHRGIWLEVADIRYGTDEPGGCQVQLKGDKERPAPVWWQVEPFKPADKSEGKKPDEAKAKESQFDTFKTISDQLDKKRVVLAWLSCGSTPEHELICKAFRFQSPELGSR